MFESEMHNLKVIMQRRELTPEEKEHFEFYEWVQKREEEQLAWKEAHKKQSFRIFYYDFKNTMFASDVKKDFGTYDPRTKSIRVVATEPQSKELLKKLAEKFDKMHPEDITYTHGGEWRPLNRCCGVTLTEDRSAIRAQVVEKVAPKTTEALDIYEKYNQRFSAKKGA